MKRSLIAMGLVLLGAAGAYAHEEKMLARVTVYWASGGSGSDSWTRNHQAATSVRLRAGHCAVDPRRIPYGSKVIVGDTTCTAVDTGKHVVSRRAARKAGRTPSERDAIVIDRFFETKGQALAWAGRNPHFMTVQIVSPNERSLVASPNGPATIALTQKTTLAGANRVGPRQTNPTALARAPITKAGLQRSSQVALLSRKTEVPKPEAAPLPPQAPLAGRGKVVADAHPLRRVTYLP